MTQVIPLYCKDCGYHGLYDHDDGFCILESKIYESQYFLIISLMEHEKDVNISGLILKSFCSKCNKPLKSYLILNQDDNEVITGIYDNLSNKWRNDSKDDDIEYIYFVGTITEKDRLKILEYNNFTIDFVQDIEDCKILRDEHFEKVIKCPICENEIKLNSKEKHKCPNVMVNYITFSLMNH